MTEIAAMESAADVAAVAATSASAIVRRDDVVRRRVVSRAITSGALATLA
jgi:hypothetical protein